MDNKTWRRSNVSKENYSSIQSRKQPLSKPQTLCDVRLSLPMRVLSFRPRRCFSHISPSTEDIGHSDIGHSLGSGPGFGIGVTRVRVLGIGLASHVGSATVVNVQMCDFEYPSNLMTVLLAQ